MSTDVDVLRRLSNLERQVKALMRHTDMPEPAIDSDLSDETKAKIRDAKPMEAVKAIRQELGCDLAHAQDVYDQAF